MLTKVLLLLLLISWFSPAIVLGNLAHEQCAQDILPHGSDAQALITGLFSVRKQDSHNAGFGYKPKVCGPVDKKGVQVVEAVRWAIDMLNQDSGTVFGVPVTQSFVPGVRLGLNAYDTCGQTAVAMRSVFEVYADAYSPSHKCFFNDTQINLGVLGPGDSGAAKDVASFLTYSEHPVISYGAVSTDLNIKDHYNGFFRTVPDAKMEAEVMVRLAKEQFKWTQVALVYCDSPYGLDGKKHILEAAHRMGLCISNIEIIPTKDIDTKLDDFERVTKRLLENRPHAPSVLVFSCRNSAEQFAKTLFSKDWLPASQQLQLIFSNSFTRDDSMFWTLPEARGIFTISGDWPLKVPDFSDHWNTLNPEAAGASSWYKEQFQREFKCRLLDETNAELLRLPLCNENSGSDRQDHEENYDLVPALDALYLYAATLREAWSQKCRNRPGLCPMLVQMQNKEFLSIISKADLSYNNSSRTPPAMYGRRMTASSIAKRLGVYQLVLGKLPDDAAVSFKQVYSFAWETQKFSVISPPTFYTVTGSELDSPPPSTCVGQCACSNIRADMQYVFSPGDLVITGFFPIHDVSGRSQDQCGPIKKSNGLFLQEAFQYALNNVNSKQGSFVDMLRGITLGALSMDSCSSPSRAAYLISGLISGEAEFKTNDGFLNPNDVVGVVGDAYDNTTQEIASLLRYSRLPLLSYGGKSVRLSDRSNYAVLRTSVSDTTYLNALFALLGQMGWNYVQVFYSPNEFGRALKDEFTAMARERRICVAQAIGIPSMPEAMANLPAVLKQKPLAKVVLVFATESNLVAMFKTLKDSKISEEYQFVILRNGDSKALLFQAGKALENAITFATTRSANVKFTQQLLARKINQLDNTNPWLPEYVRSLFNCDIGSCDGAMTLADAGDVIAQDDLSNDVINAVYAFARGLHAMLDQYCGAGYNGSCSAFRTLPQRNAILLDYVSKAQFEDETKQPFLFTKDNDRQGEIDIYSIQENPRTALLYSTQAGTYPPAEGINLVTTPEVLANLHAVNSTCENVHQCAECYSTLRWNDQTNLSPPPAPVTENPDFKKRSELGDVRFKPKKLYLMRPSPQKVNLVALVAVHKKGTLPFECGELSEEGILALEAFLWAVDMINVNGNVLPGVEIGTIVFDTCGSAAQVYDDLKTFFADPTVYARDNNTVMLDDIFGAILPPENNAAVSAAEVFNAYSVINVGPGSTTRVLDNRELYPFTLRTSLPDTVTNKALVAFLVAQNWTYVSVVYQSTPNGLTKFQDFQSQAMERGLCFGAAVGISGTPGPHFSSIMPQLYAEAKHGARGVVMLLDEPLLASFIQFYNSEVENDRTPKGTLTFLIPEPIGSNMEFALTENIQTALGAVYAKYDTRPVDYLRDYFDSMGYMDNTRNPWWPDFWHKRFNCEDIETCSRFKLEHDPAMMENPLVINTITATWALAVGLNSIQEHFCEKRGQTTEMALCNAVHKLPNRRQVIFDTVKDSALTRPDIPEESFTFTKEGYGNIGMKFVNVVPNDATGEVKLAQVAYFHRDNLTLIEQPMQMISAVFEPWNKSISACRNPDVCPQCKLVREKIVIKEVEVTKTIYVTHPTTTPLQTNATTTATSTTTTTSTTSTASTTTSTTPTTTATTATSSVEAKSTSVTLPASAVYADDFVYIPSPDGVIIPATFAVHREGHAPFSCGSIRFDSYQLVEAFTWALDRINKNSSFLPGVQLGAIILDTCSNPEKSLRDVANFLSNQVVFVAPGSISKIDPASSVAMVTSVDSEEALLNANLLSDWLITSISPGASASVLNSEEKFPYLLRTSVPTNLQALAFVDLLKQLGWQSVSVLYTDDVWGLSALDDFRNLASEAGICLALSEGLPRQCEQQARRIDRTISRLITVKSAGTRAVVLWLTAENFKCVLEGVQRARLAGQVRPGDFSWLLGSDLASMDAAIASSELDAVGLVALSYPHDPMTDFETHWQSLTVKGADGQLKNPWVLEMFELLFGCKGFEQCSTQSMDVFPYASNTYLLNTINAVYTIAGGLETVRQQMCGVGSVGMCARMKNDPQFRQRVFDAVRGVDFKDLSGRQFHFAKNRYGNQPLEVLNLISDGKVYEFRTIGQFENTKLTLYDEPKGFDNGVEPFQLKSKPSVCTMPQMCMACKRFETTSMPPSVGSTSKLPNRPVTPSTQAPRSESQSPLISEFVAFPSPQKFAIAGVFPVHQQGTSPFTCGPVNPASGFQKLAAFMFALDEVNSDPYLMRGIQLGAIAIDSCSSESRAEAGFFEFLSGVQNTPVDATSLVSLVGTGDPYSWNLVSMLEQAELTQISAQPLPLSLKKNKFMLGTASADDVIVHVFLGILRRMSWSYVSVVHDASATYEATARFFMQQAQKSGICVAKSLSLETDARPEDAQIAVRQLVTTSGSNVVVLLLSDANVVQFVKALSVERVSAGRFMLMLAFNEDWMYDQEFLGSLSRFNQGALTVEMQRYNTTRFVQWLSALTPDKHDPIPKHWFDEFWQQTFSCSLKSSIVRATQFANQPCTGHERIEPATFQQSPAVLPTIMGVHAAARGLQKFLDTFCPGRGNSVFSLSECVQQSPNMRFVDTLKTLNFSYTYDAMQPPVWINFDEHGFRSTEYSVRTLVRQPDGNFRYEQVGHWRDGLGELNFTKIFLLDARGERVSPRSQCVENCVMCGNVSSVAIASAQPLTNVNFDSAWGIIVTVVTGLGMLVSFIAMLYFVFTVSMSYGSTILGYMILGGLFLLYLLALAYVVPPCEAACIIRRYCTGLCWALIFGPMFVKVCYNYYLRSIRGPGVPGIPKSRPWVLFLLGFAAFLVQGIIEIEWAMLQPLDTYVTFVDKYQDRMLEPGYWRCAPGDAFESSVVVSLIYVMVLIVLCSVFSLLGWSSDQYNHESRWIFASCICTIGVWLAWTLVATQTAHEFRDAAIAIGIVVNATIILMFLFMRKLYAANRLKNGSSGGEPSTYQSAATMIGGSYLMDSSLYGTKVFVAPPTMPMARIALPCTEPVVYHNNVAYDGGAEFNPNRISHSSSGVLIYEAGVNRSSSELSARL